ncbi:MAG: AAA family ATPase [Bifidobacteriaceae bacterium]|nr:AAA family ATPase [Bifidobacteriaceae bacterium]
MHLKELTLKGFKSFASATTLHFEPGITAVVGPNGSGKSNIVDALTWVMGEQGAKNLRGTSMEDVIFAGTSSRPPLGRAQVTLTIDNSDHVLDIEYSEVTISRTIFRNGGSEYAINGNQCRLLDIQELLSDTGLGQQMHVIVGQGRLDAILRADPSGHRAFIEEAAGILKHRKRKERAIRKLAHAQENVSRLDDLLHEIQRQLGPLRRQAKISKRADNIKIALRDAQSRLYADEAQQLITRRNTVRETLSNVREQLLVQQKELTSVKLRIENIEALSSQSNPQMSVLNSTWRELNQVQERLHSLASLAQERSNSLLNQIVTHVGDDPSILISRAEELEKQAESTQEQVNVQRMSFDKATEKRAETEKQLAATRQTITQLRSLAQERDERLARMRELIAKEEAAMNISSTREQDLLKQQEDVSAQLEQTRASLKELEETQDFEEDNHSVELAREELQKKQEALDLLEKEHRDIESSIISLQAKADALQDTLEHRVDSAALEHDTSISMLGSLTDFIRVQDGWEEAIARSLDAFSSATIVKNKDNIIYALQKAKDEKLGKAVLLFPSEHTHSCKEYEAGNYIIANPLASDEHIAQQVVTAVQEILEHTALAENIESAYQLINNGWEKVVTKDGEIVYQNAAIGGSSLSQSNIALVSKRDKALAQVQELQAKLHDVDTKLQAAVESRDKARELANEKAQERAAMRIKIQQAQKEREQTTARIDHLTKQYNDLQQSIQQSKDSCKEHELTLHDLQTALENTQNSTDSNNSNFDELTQREVSLQKQLDQTREAEVTAKVAWNEAQQKTQSYTRQASLLRDNAQQSVRKRERIEEENKQCQEKAQLAEHIAYDAKAIAAMVAQDIVRVNDQREKLQIEVSSNDEELKVLRSQRNQLEEVVGDLTKRVHESDVEREHVSVAFGQIVQKVSDDLSMDIDTLVAQYGPHMPIPVLDDEGQPILLEQNNDANAQEEDSQSAHTQEASSHNTSSPSEFEAIENINALNADQLRTVYKTVPYNKQEQQKRLEKARKDLAALGKVNPLAAEEYDALEVRNTYLHNQRTDVVKSRDDLMRLIKDLDKTMAQVFTQAFEDTAQAFETVFATLFPGGTGRLRLENPDDPLTSGVIVEASPAGKRVKQLSLLSGGERSLTALALLFAIFTARPSPFYVMDEVEAALDDINLSRLLNALQDLRQHAQLIIITHQQRTMSIADALYGITMRSDGVTAVISQKLEREEK